MKKVHKVNIHHYTLTHHPILINLIFYFRYRIKIDTISWINRLHQTVLKEKGLNNEVKDINENISRLIAKRKNIFNKLKANESQRIYLMSIRLKK
jgi:hypothetical protein